ncbi:unnamed protein product [Discosporangium mesarthrocarpum]
MGTRTRTSRSDHELFRKSLNATWWYVFVERIFGALLLAGAWDIWTSSMWPILGILGRESGENFGRGDAKRRRMGAMSLTTAGVVVLIVSYMVRKSCHQSSGNIIDINWHDLFKSTHLGRTISAAMGAVLTWRGCDSYANAAGNRETSSDRGRGFIDRETAILWGAAFLSIVVAGVLHSLHFKVRATYMDYTALKKAKKAQ